MDGYPLEHESHDVKESIVEGVGICGRSAKAI